MGLKLYFKTVRYIYSMVIRRVKRRKRWKERGVYPGFRRYILRCRPNGKNSPLSLLVMHILHSFIVHCAVFSIRVPSVYAPSMHTFIYTIDIYVYCK